ncbi:hypothetical protein KC342_g70 [Hortaea werneckii]|nr:hypothetical protein KC342_g70 [Hortaea werneckii]
MDGDVAASVSVYVLGIGLASSSVRFSLFQQSHSAGAPLDDSIQHLRLRPRHPLDLRVSSPGVARLASLTKCAEGGRRDNRRRN